MRIAIVCNGRSGSTSLTNLINCSLLSQGKKYSLFFEPFNYRNVDKNNKIKKIDDIINKENILLKTFIDRDNFPYESFKDVNEYWDWFYTFFDKIIVLERINKRLQSESLAYHLKISKDKTVTPHWHKQKYYDLSIIDENELINLTKHLELDSIFLKEISNKGYPHYTYEKIFVDKDTETINNILTYLELSYNQKCIDMWINSPYKKVRLDEKTNKLL
jgi:hypothetical protein